MATNKPSDQISKLYITPDELRKDSFVLGMKVIKDGFRPDFMVALWRGGAPIGCNIHELLKWKGINSDHIAIRTSKYTGIDKADSRVVVHNLSYLVENIKPGDKILLVDDVWDSGSSIVAFKETLEYRLIDACGGTSTPTDVRVATMFYKPSRNVSGQVPDYYVHETDRWLVFPHELEGMDLAEVELAFGKDISGIIA